MYTTKTAVVGTGFIGPVHVEGLKRLGVHITGILGSSPEKSEKARQSLALPKSYHSFDDVLNHNDVQAVHLAVPNILHYDMAKKALLAGKHVMCEKPLAMTSEETTELVAIAAKSGLQAGVCYNIRFYPLNLEAAQQIRNGNIGDVFSVVGSYVQDWLLFETDYNWRVLADQGGALRAVADIGTHWMDLVSSVTGLKISAVFADLKTVFPVRKRPKGEVETFSGKKQSAADLEDVAIDTEDCGAVLLRFTNGARGVLWVSQLTAGRKNCLSYEISGSQKALSWNSERPNDLWIGNRNEPNALLNRDPSLLSDAVAGFANYPGGHNEGFPDTFKQCFRAFYNAIEGRSTGGITYPTFEEGHQEVAICEAILKSHQEERWIEI